MKVRKTDRQRIGLDYNSAFKLLSSLLSHMSLSLINKCNGFLTYTKPFYSFWGGGRPQRNPYAALATYFLAYTMDCLASVVMKASHLEFQAAIIRGILCVSPELDFCFPVPHAFLLLGLFHQFGRCLGVSISGIKHHNQMQHVEQRDYSAYISRVTLHQRGKSHRNSQREPKGRN